MKKSFILGILALLTMVVVLAGCTGEAVKVKAPTTNVVFPATEGGLQSAGSIGLSVYDNEVNAKGSSPLYIQHSGITGNGPTLIGSTLYVQNVQNASGNVGIGTTTPLAKLDVNGAIRLANNKAIVGASANNIGDLDIARVGTGNELIIGHGNNGNLQFVTGGTNGVPSMFIANGGNVGIGTTSPTEKLDVRGNMTVAGYINITGLIIKDEKGQPWCCGPSTKGEWSCKAATSGCSEAVAFLIGAYGIAVPASK